MKTTYIVSGMDCASCAQIITKKISKIDSVISCDVNFATKQAIVTSENIVSDVLLNDTIIPYGYSLQQNKGSSADISDNPSGNTIAPLISKGHIIAIAIMILIVFLMMGRDVGMSYHWRSSNEIVHDFFHHLMPIFATYLFFGLGMRYVKAAFSYFIYRVGNMDSLIGIGGIVAFIYSFIVTAFEKSLAPVMDVSWNFYEGIIVVIGFSIIGKYIEDTQLVKTGEAIASLMKLQSKEALVLKDGVEMRVPIDHIQVGDTIIIKPGEQVPVDGRILTGVTEINESMITGEPLPLVKNIGDIVIGGTMNVNGYITITASHIGSQTTLSKIVSMVSQAQFFKPSIQKLTDKIAEYFVPGTLIIAILTLVGRLLLGHGVYSNYRIRGIIGFVAILSVACPCALGLATPLAVINSISRATRNGILVKNSEGLLQLKHVDTIVFDKTGTITTGKPTMLVEDTHNRQNLCILYSLEILSNHPISHAIVTVCEQKGIQSSHVEDFLTLPGYGLQGSIDGHNYYVGNLAYAQKKLGIDTINISHITKQGQTPVILFDDTHVLDIYGIIDTIKPYISETISILHSLGIKTIMCTGDHYDTAQYIASQLGIDQVVAGVSPEGKADLIKKLRGDGSKKIAMIGDGINDSIALSLADVSIGMSDGSDVSIESSDLILLHGDLKKVLTAITISKSMNTLISQNLFRAFSYNLIGIPLAGGWLFPWFGWQLTPVFSGLFMALSSIIVSINSMRGR